MSLQNVLQMKHNRALILLALISAIPIGLVHFLPLFDYPHWVYQAHVLSHYVDYQSWYKVNWMPVPNLGSTLPLLLLAPLVGAEVGTKVLLAIYAVTMVLGFAYCVRSITGRPVVTELVGPILVYNYFFYNGFLSYTLGLPIILVAIGFMIRFGTKLNRSHLVVIALLSCAAYLCHLFIWLPLLLAISIGVITRKLNQILLLSQLPPILLLIVYTYNRNSSGGIDFQPYESVPNKLFSLFGPDQMFQRADPLETILPIMILNVITFLIIAWLSFRAIRSATTTKSMDSTRFLALFTIYLFISAILIPFTWFAGMGSIDQRLSYSAYMIALVLVAATSAGQVYRGFPILLSLAVVIVHSINFVGYDSQLREVHQAIQTRPPNASVYVASLRHPPLYGACETDTLLNAGNGVFALQWFPLYDAVERGGIAAQTFDTAVLQPRTNAALPMRFGQYLSESEVNSLVKMIVQPSNIYDYVFLFGCSNDIRHAEKLLAPLGDFIDRGAIYSILRVRPITNE
jgi:hypothetical protein